jgi:hypothetical protein
LEYGVSTQVRGIYANEIGNMAMTVILGDETLTSVENDVEKAVREFNSTLLNYASVVGFRTFEIGSQALDEVQGRDFLSLLTQEHFAKNLVNRYKPTLRGLV